jgi:hypothetical protein
MHTLIHPLRYPYISSPLNLRSNTVDLKIGNFRASYLDFRPYIVLESNPNDTQRYAQADCVRHAIQTLLSLGRENGTGPDVFHLELPWSSDSMEVRPTTGIVSEVDYIGLVRSWLGAQWKGKMLVTSRKLRSSGYSDPTPRNRFQKPEIYDWLDAHPNNLDGVAFVDETSLAAGALHETIKVGYAEKMTHGWSFHYHRQCNESGLQVCSPVCDAAFQQILNVAFGRFEKKTMLMHLRQRRNDCCHAPTQAPSDRRQELQFCIQCPKSLFPLAILPLRSSNLSCYDILPA